MVFLNQKGRDSTQEGAGVGVLGVVEELLGRADLHDLSGEHHRHAVGDVADRGDVVADEDHAEAARPSGR